MRARFACLLSVFLFAANLQAQTTIHIPADQPTIQAGINAAHDGDTVLIAPGTYNENIDFNGKAITVISSDGPAKTTINGNAQSATVSFQNGESRNSVLQNLTITGGGGNFYASKGGVYALHASPSILNNTITDAGCNGIVSLAAAPLIQGNDITRTHVDPATMDGCGDANGAGIWVNGTDATLTNFPTSQGLRPEILHNLIEKNTEAGTIDGDTLGGAGIAVRAGAVPLIEYNVIRQNSLNTAVQHGGTGGGILVFAAGALIVNNLIDLNTAISGGGGISVWNYGTFSSQFALINNTIAYNDLQELPAYLGALAFGGAEVYLSGSHPFFLLNNVLSGHSVSPSLSCSLDPSVFFTTLPPTTYFVSNDVFNGLGPSTDSAGPNTCSYPADLQGNLSLDPLLANPSSEDFRLDPGSPAIDSGANSAIGEARVDGFAFATDLDGNPRVLNATGTSIARIDMGAYEALGTTQPNPPTQPTPPTQTATQTVIAAAPNPAYQGQSVTISITVSASGGATPTGAVNLYDGSTLLATPILSASGQATFTTPSLAVGSHSLTATFSAQGNLLASTSPAVQETVLASGFTLALTPTALNLTGSSASVNVALASIGNFSGPLTLSTGVLPSNLSATFSSSSATLGPGQTTSVSLKLNAAPKAASNHATPIPGRRSWPAVALALLLPVALRRRQTFRRPVFLLVTLALLPWITGCTTLGTPLDETPVTVTTYTLPVIATDAQGHQQTARLALTITP